MMYLSKLSILVFLGMIVASTAQVSEDDFLSAHNEARAKYGIPPLVWDPEVERYAQNYAQVRTDCQLIHSNGKYGENIAYSTDPGFSAKAAMDIWMSEEQYYDYASNTCQPNQQCLHYTQILWRDSKRLGCASSSCTNGGRFITCNFDPPGNYIGQKPY